MKFAKIFVILFFLLFYVGNSKSPSRGREAIDIVLCLDLSASTNGLIDDVREKLWDIVNQVNSYRPAPEFRIGVVGFSRPSFLAKNGYVKILSKLTSDYDQLSFELYKLRPTIEKGDQLVGEALRTAVKEMNWVEDDQALRVIYVVGNGTVNLGGDNYREACEQAAKRKIIVNSLYCRTRNNAEKELPGWREIARLTGGEQYDIQIHKRTPLILSSPDLMSFRSLADKLSDTYIYYGKNGADSYKVMASNDKNAFMANEMTFESRLFYKISDRYQFHQQNWDMVDYLKMSNSNFEEIEMQYLPDSLKFKNSSYVRDLTMRLKDDRVRVLSELRKHLPYDRQATINKKLEDREIDKANIFDRVVVNSLNQLATEKGFSTGTSASIDFRK